MKRFKDFILRKKNYIFVILFLVQGCQILVQKSEIDDLRANVLYSSSYDFSSLKSDVSSLKSDVSSVKSDVSSLRSKVNYGY